MKSEIVFISPYRKLTDQVNAVIRECNIKNIMVYEGNLEDGLKLAIKAVNQGATIVISRGGTFQLLKKNLHVVVLELKLTIFDIYKTVEYFISPKEDVAIIGYDNVIQTYNLLRNINPKNVHVCPLHINDEVSNRVEQFVLKGINFFIGDVVVTNYCKKMNYPCETIESSKESIHLVLEDATSVLEGQRKEIEFKQRYSLLMDHVHDGFIGTDENSLIITCNAMAEFLLKTKKSDLVGKKIQTIKKLQVFMDIYNHTDTVRDEVIVFEGNNLASSCIPIVVRDNLRGKLLVFQEVTDIQKIENKIRKKVLGHGFETRYTLSDIIGTSPEIKKCIYLAEQYSQYDATVLIEGRTGVGKELFAQGIHSESKRKNHPFVAVNCAAIPESLIDSELFGYEEGAFTGSRKGGRAGMFELAHNGTIFLDEVSELPLLAQGRLLRVIQERQIIRVGGIVAVPINVRIICATNRHLNLYVEKGKFREDLLYRLNVLNIIIPDLKNRQDDIRELLLYYLSHFTESYGKQGLNFAKQTLDFLINYDYPGNIRQLASLVERGTILAQTQLIELEDIFPSDDSLHVMAEKNYQITDEFKRLPTLKELEKVYIKYVQGKVKTNQEASKILGVNPSTIYRKRNN